MSYVIDTHALLWHLTGEKRLGQGASSVLSARDAILFLPAIAFLEACWTVEHGKTPAYSVNKLLTAIRADKRLSILPLTEDIIVLSLTLQDINEIHDRQIVATTLWLQQSDPTVALITNDRMITSSGLVPVLW